LYGKHLGRLAVLALLLATTGTVAQDAGSSRKYISEGREAFVNRTTPACRAAFRYVELLTEEKFSELRSLFADEVDYIGPDGKPLSRGEDVGALYARVGPQMNGRTKAKIDSLVPVGANECLMEFRTLVDPAAGLYKLSAVDHFTVAADGKVTRFVPYFQTALLHSSP
jgi:SnoaL-like domain